MGYSRATKQVKLRKMAEAMTNQMHGTYPWSEESIGGTGGYKTAQTNAGTWRTSKLECLRAAGYAPRKFNYGLFEDPYYLEQLRLCEEERLGNKNVVLKNFENAGVIADISARSLILLKERLNSVDPAHRVSTGDLIKIADVFTKMDTEIRASRGKGDENSTGQLMKAMAGNQRLPAASRDTAADRIKARLDEYAALRVDQITDAEILGRAEDNTVDVEAVES
jgi:hypothetical protein